MDEDVGVNSRPLGGLFGLGDPLRAGELTPQEQVESAIRRHMLADALLIWRRRGAPVAPWRKDLREKALAVMRIVPDASDAEIARAFWDDKSWPNLKKRANVTNVRTIQNWLSEIRRGKPGYGRRMPKVR